MEKGDSGAGGFFVQALPESVKCSMMGNSFRENPYISLDDLVLVKALYYGFDGRTHQGEMVIHRDLGEELAEILKELHEKNFPIENMKRIDVFGGDDERSMSANNSSAFCYRQLTGGGGLSCHAMGRAVDINPMYNPYIWKGRDSLHILPPEAASYMKRDPGRKGTIVRGGDCYNAFVKRGWTWGGDWEQPVDLHHFEKPV